MPEEVETAARTRLGGRLKWVEGELAKGPDLIGRAFTVADAYLFTVVGWSRLVGVDISALPRSASSWPGCGRARRCRQRCARKVC